MRIVSFLLLKRWRPQLETAVRPDSPRETVVVLYYFCQDIRTTSRAVGWSGVHRLAVVFDIPRFFLTLTHSVFFFSFFLFAIFRVGMFAVMNVCVPAYKIKYIARSHSKIGWHTGPRLEGQRNFYSHQRKVSVGDVDLDPVEVGGRYVDRTLRPRRTADCRPGNVTIVTAVAVVTPLLPLLLPLRRFVSAVTVGE